MNEISALYIAFECLTGTVLLNGDYSAALLHRVIQTIRYLVQNIVKYWTGNISSITRIDDSGIFILSCLTSLDHGILKLKVKSESKLCSLTLTSASNCTLRLGMLILFWVIYTKIWIQYP